VVRRRLKFAMWGIIAFFLCLGTASLVTYMVIGREHAPYAGERYLPAHKQSQPG
jgi:fumarate reductase subunit C